MPDPPSRQNEARGIEEANVAWCDEHGAQWFSPSGDVSRYTCWRVTFDGFVRGTCGRPLVRRRMRVVKEAEDVLPMTGRQNDAPRLVVRCTAGHERPFLNAEDAEGTCRAPGWLAGWCGCRESVVEDPSRGRNV